MAPITLGLMVAIGFFLRISMTMILLGLVYQKKRPLQTLKPSIRFVRSWKLQEYNFIERQGLHKSMNSLYKTIQGRSGRLKHMPARKRAALQKRTAKAFDAVYGSAWRD